MQSSEVKQYLSDVLDAQGLKLTKLNKNLLSLIDNPMKEAITKDGSIIELKDNATQLEAIKLGYKLHKVIDNAPTSIVDARTINVNTADKAVVDSLSKVSEILLKINASLALIPREMSGEIGDDKSGENIIPNIVDNSKVDEVIDIDIDSNMSVDDKVTPLPTNQSFQ